MKRSVALRLAFVILVLSCVVLGFTVGVAEKSDSNAENVKDEYYVFENSIVKAENKLNTTMADYAIRLFSRVNDEMLIESNNCYFALIPDKEKLINDNYVLYDEFYEYFVTGLEFTTSIEIFDLLEFSDYYRTDPHIKQEALVDVAVKISEAMGNISESEFTVNDSDTEFVGNYVGKSGLEVSPDEFKYLSSDVIDSFTVSDSIELYNFEKLTTDEPYDFFLSGNQSVVTIRNENAETDKRLVVFRDSFGSNLAPLLATSYKETVLVDLRYIMSDYVPKYVDFENADVLFIYSTLLLNNSMSMK